MTTSNVCGLTQNERSLDDGGDGHDDGRREGVRDGDGERQVEVVVWIAARQDEASESGRVVTRRQHLH